MLSLRKHFGTAGLLLAVAALVAALGGSAIAANGGGSGDATASAKRGGNVNKLIKRESQKFSKRFSQRFSRRFAIPGPIGPQGFPGLPGSDGDDGSDGSDGDDGSNGVSVTSEEFGGEEGSCEEGGSKFTSASGDTYACDGSPWTLGGTLPEGATLTGAWGIAGQAGLSTQPVSLPLPFATAPEASNIHFHEPGYEGLEATCPGTAEEPKAANGEICIYAQVQEETNYIAGGGFPIVSGSSGALVAFELEDEFTSIAFGTWAATGN